LQAPFYRVLTIERTIVQFDQTFASDAIIIDQSVVKNMVDDLVVLFLGSVLVEQGMVLLVYKAAKIW
jgi:hypothetical protein